MNIQQQITMDEDVQPAPNALIPRSTIEQIVGYRNKALELYAEAFDKIAVASAAVDKAAGMWKLASPGINNYNSTRADEVKAFHHAVCLPDRAQYNRVARRLIDIDVWAWIIERTDLERLMDHEAKQTLRNQMDYVPERVDPKTNQLITGEEIEKGLPEVTVENIYATLEKFSMDADMIFRRGMANVFSKLDRRFRSHDGFKVGARMILTYAFDSFSGRLQWGSVRDQLIDVERVFSILDGRPKASFTSALYAIEQSRRGGSYGPKQSYVETDYFRIRGFKNGNAHLWFVRDDLVEKVNKLLAEYYGEVIADGQTQEEDIFERIKTTPAKYYGFYPTPEEAAARLVGGLSLYREIKEPRITVLEPSAGTGNLTSRCFPDREQRRHRLHDPDDKYRWDAIVDAVEIQPHLANGLKADRRLRKVYCQDFLTLSPKTTGLYDYVVMNPPFDRERDIDHVIHALDFLKPDGSLHAIMSAGTEFRETRKATAFRALMQKMGASWDDLPPGSFASVGTYINTLVLRVNKDGSRMSSYRYRY